jgi:rod shape-determining protein MreC
MAFAGGGINSPSAREAAPGGRFFFFALLSLVLMYFDQKDGWGGRVRYALQAVAYPIQYTVGLPRRLWNGSSEMFETRASLREQNEALQKRVREMTLRTQTFESLEQENAQLRALTVSLPPLVQKSMLADVVNAELTNRKQRLVINKGSGAGLFRSQALVDATGLIGQLVRVGPWSAEVMLISDVEAAVQVQIVRSGERGILVGTGNSRELKVDYLPATTDVKVGDLLVTSGLGGVFPAGVPVGKVIESRRDPDDLLAHVRVEPLAQLDRSRQLMALWFDPSNPAAPPTPQMLETLPPASIADPVTRSQPRKTKPAAASTPAAPATPPARATTPATRPATPPAAPRAETPAVATPEGVEPTRADAEPAPAAATPAAPPEPQ